MYHKFISRVVEIKKMKRSLKMISESQTYSLNDRINDLFLNIHHMSDLKPVKSEWFTNLSTYDMYKLYRESQDWWHHRMQLSSNDKRIFLKYFDQRGDIFLTSHNSVRLLSRDDIIKEIIYSYERLISEGITEEDCKAGIFNVISMLVTVSTISRYGENSAEFAHPYLKQ